jgi:hypothetical protein
MISLSPLLIAVAALLAGAVWSFLDARRSQAARVARQAAQQSEIAAARREIATVAAAQQAEIATVAAAQKAEIAAIRREVADGLAALRRDAAQTKVETPAPAVLPAAPPLGGRELESLKLTLQLLSTRLAALEARSPAPPPAGGDRECTMLPGAPSPKPMAMTTPTTPPATPPPPMPPPTPPPTVPEPRSAEGDSVDERLTPDAETVMGCRRALDAALRAAAVGDQDDEETRRGGTPDLGPAPRTAGRPPHRPPPLPRTVARVEQKGRAT